MADIQSIPEIASNFANALVDNTSDAFLIFTDISDSSKLSNEDPQEYFIRCFNHILFSFKTLKTAKRNLVKTIGDEVMLTEILYINKKQDRGNMAKELLTSVLEFQHFLFDRAKISTKIAIHLCKGVISGELLNELASQREETKDFKSHHGDIFGKDVNFGARLMSVAQKGQVLISEAVFNLLSKDEKQRAMQKKEVFKSKRNKNVIKVKFDMPMYFSFKGFNKSEDQPDFHKVIQVYDSRNTSNLLSACGYKYKCLTFFDINCRKYKKGIKTLIDTIRAVFPKKSYPYFFTREGSTVADAKNFPYDVGVLFRIQNYETYSRLHSVLLHRLRDIPDFLNSGFTNPIWDGHEISLRDISGVKKLTFLRTKSLNHTLGLQKETKHYPLSLIVVGYYDNFIISGKSANLENKFKQYLYDQRDDSIKDCDVKITLDENIGAWL